MRNSEDKTQFSLLLGDSRLQAYKAQSHSRLTQWKHNLKTLLEIVTFILNTIPHQKSSVKITSNIRRQRFAWKSAVKEAYYYLEA